MADVRLAEAKQLLDAGLWNGAYYLTGYAAELALKACIIRLLLTTDEFPAKNFSSRCYTHALEELFDVARLTSDFNTACSIDSDLKDNWSIVKDWTEQKRYHLISQVEAEACYQAMSESQHGALPWIRSRW